MKKFASLLVAAVALAAIATVWFVALTEFSFQGELGYGIVQR